MMVCGDESAEEKGSKGSGVRDLGSGSLFLDGGLTLTFPVSRRGIPGSA